MSTVEYARREVRECLQNGCGLDYIGVFLSDLIRGGNITWQEAKEIVNDLFDGRFGDIKRLLDTE